MSPLFLETQALARQRPLTAFAGAVAGLHVALLLWPSASALPRRAASGQTIVFDGPGCTEVWTHVAPAGDPWGYHPGDAGFRGRCVSQSLTLTPGLPYLLIQYAGVPSHRDVALGLDTTGDGEIDVPVALVGAARHGWQTEAVFVPGVSGAVRLVIEDRGDGSSSWATVRRIVQADVPVVSAPVRRLPRGLSAVLMATLALLAFGLGGADARRRFVALFALGSVMFLQLRAFHTQDDLPLLLSAAVGRTGVEWFAYNGQFCPLFLWTHAALSGLVGGQYGLLQVLMLAGHAATAMLLSAVLRADGIGRRISTVVGILYLTSWAHVDVVPWFMELVFMSSTAASVVAILFGMRFAQRARRKDLLAAAAASSVAFLCFAGAAVTPFIIAAYFALKRQPRWALASGALGLAFGGITLAFADSGELVTDQPLPARVAEIAAYMARGGVQGSLLSLVGLRNFPWLGGLLALAAVASALALTGASLGWRIGTRLVMGLVWIMGAYALQAVVRSHLGTDQAIGFRYTYFGMTGAAFLLATLLQWLAVGVRAARLKYTRWLPVAAAVAVTALAVHNHDRFLTRITHHEAEYFARARQMYDLARARIALAGHTDPPPNPLPATLHPGMSIARYLTVVEFVAAVGKRVDGQPGALPARGVDSLMAP